MKKSMKQLLKKSISILLMASMLAPSGAPVIAYGAEAVLSRPRNVSFTRPAALKLSDVGISSSGNDSGGGGGNSERDASDGGSESSRGGSQSSDNSSGGSSDSAGGGNSGENGSSGGGNDSSDSGSSGGSESDGNSGSGNGSENDGNGSSGGSESGGESSDGGSSSSGNTGGEETGGTETGGEEAGGSETGGEESESGETGDGGNTGETGGEGSSESGETDGSETEGNTGSGEESGTEGSDEGGEDREPDASGETGGTKEPEETEGADQPEESEGTNEADEPETSGQEDTKPSEETDESEPEESEDGTGLGGGSGSSGSSGGSGGGSNAGSGALDGTGAEKPEAEEPEKTEEELEQEKLEEELLEELEKEEQEATPSDALREPEPFYNLEIDEPDGRLVQFNDRYRTYEMGEHEYITIVGGYSGLYLNEEGFVEEIDNSLTEVEDADDLGMEQDGSLVRRIARRMAVATTTTYRNGDSPVDILLPEDMSSSKGYVISRGEDSVEVRPADGNFEDGVAVDNAIRYSNVFDNVDFQYTVLGNTIKEDIILLEPQERNEFSYYLKSDSLKFKKQDGCVVAYESSADDPVFVFRAPIMYDANGYSSIDIDLDFNASNGKLTITADQDWLEDEDRAYPVRIDPDMSLMSSQDFHMAMVADGNGTNPDNDPQAIRAYYFGESQMMVGYSEDFGNCRMLINLSPDWEQVIARDNEINNSPDRPEEVAPGMERVVFKAGVKTNDARDRSIFQIYGLKQDWSYTDISWNKMKDSKLDSGLATADESMSSGQDTYMTFDITDIYHTWFDDPANRNGLMMRVEVEGPIDSLDDVMWADTLARGNDPTVPPRLEVSWYGDLAETDPSQMDINDFTIEVGPGVTETENGSNTTEGVVAYGQSQAESTISYTLKQVSGGTVTSDETTAESEWLYPDYTLVEELCVDAILKNANWQSEASMYDDDLRLNTIYVYEAEATGYALEEDPETGEMVPSGEEVTSETKESDEFLLYKVQATDLISRIAKYYGTSTEQIKADNQLDDRLTEAGTILFIRNPGTDVPYTFEIPQDKMERFLLECALNGEDPRCLSFGEPVNTSTGSFYMSQTDSELEDLGGTFSITRSYGSTTPYFRSEFGMGWNSLAGEKIMVLEDGTIIYVAKDGKGLIFDGQEDGTYKAPDGYDYILEPLDTLEGIEGIQTASPSDAQREEEDDLEETGTEEATEEEEETEARIASPSTARADEADEEEEEDDSSKVPAPAGWKLTHPDGTVKIFNAYGMIIKDGNRKDQATLYAYDEEWKLNQITTPSGKIFEVTQDDEGKITQIVQPDGGIITYEYDEADDLIQVTNPSGDTKRYEYDEEHHMTAWYDENGNRVVLNTYDGDGRVVTQTDALGNTMTFQYEADGTTVVDNRGNATKFVLDGQKRNIRVEYANGQTEETSYDEENRIASRTDANGTTTSYTYDENGNVLTETREDGSGSSYTYNELSLPLTATDYENYTSSFTYDEVGNLLAMTDGEGNTTTYGYDELSRLVSITDANGGTITFTYEGTEAVPAAMTDGEGNTSTFTYDAMNRVLTQTDGEGNTTSHSYNANGWEIVTTAADGGATVYEFSPAGEVLSITDPMGVKTSFTYDAMHNILQGTDALGNTLTYEYDANYNKIKETDARGNTTSYAYDSRDRLIRTTDAKGNTVDLTLDGLGNIRAQKDRRGNSSTAEYDPVLGLPTQVTDRLGNITYYNYDRNGNITLITYADGSSTSYAYDGAGRLVSITAQNGLVTNLSYDGNGNLTQITDDETRVYTYTYDHNNQLVLAVDPLGGETRFAYDGAGNQTAVTDANGNTTDYGYDAVGRLTQIQDALDGVTSTIYDLNGRPTSATDANGHTDTYYYNEIGELLAQTDAMGYVTAYEYDSVGNMTKTTDALKGETEAVYDALNQAVTMTDAMDGEYAYQYDENGNLLQITYPDGDTVTMTYDAEDRMISRTDEAGVVTEYVYDSMGRLTKEEDSIGNVMTYGYDTSGNLLWQKDTIGRIANYEYDAFNHLTAITDYGDARTEYGYDAMDRLISVTQADGTVYSYEYDAVGNLIKTTEPGEAVYTYAYDAINRVTSQTDPLQGVTTYAYDAVGNLTGSIDAEGAATAYTYDAIDRLIQFTDGRGNNTTYEYDELSRLLGYTTPEGNKEEYRYDPLGNLTKYKDANGLITEYQYDVMGNLLKSISPKGAETTYTYDKHDEVTSVTDAMGQVTEYTVDLNRQVTKMTAKNGGEYTYDYDAVHRLTDITTPLGLHTQFAYDDADNVLSENDSLGRSNTYTYDIMRRMTSFANAKNGVTLYTYDIRGNQNSETDPLGYTWNYTYDLMDQMTQLTDPEGKATEAVYNLVGEIESITRPGGRTTSYSYDGNYNNTAVTDPKGYTYQYTYDKDNRLIGTLNPLAETEVIAYDPGSRVTSITDRMGLTESYTYDGHGNVLSVTATNGLVTQFNYDILDNLIKVTLPSGLSTSYAYDEMGNVTSMVDTMGRMTTYTYDIEGNMTSLTDAMDRKEQMTYDAGGRQTSYTSNGGNRIDYDYDVLNDLVEKSYEDERDPEGKEGVVYGYDVMGQRVSMMDRSGESSYEYDGLGRITKVTTGSGETTTYEYGINDMLSRLTYPDGKSVSYEYDLNDNLTQVTDRTGGVTTYVYDAINRVTEIHRPNGISTYNTYNARDQIVSMKNICDDCGWVVSQYDYTYDDRGFIVGEDAVESLYGYAWDDKHDGKHENGRHDDLFPHGGQHTNKHAKDGEYNFQIVETTRTFTYDEDGKLLTATENEEQQGRYDYVFEYDDMGNRTYYGKSRNGVLQESGEYTYNAANQLTQAKIYDGKKNTTLDYEYDADGNRISETGKVGTDKVENTYIYTVENRLKAVYDADDLLVAMAYDGDGNRIFQLNYNLHMDDDWKGNNGNGNGNNKDNKGQGGGTSNGTSETAETSSVPSEEGLAFIESLTSYDLSLEGVLERKADKFTASDELEALQDEAEDTEASPSNAKKTDKKNDNGNNGNNGNGGNGNHYGWENGNNGNSGNNGNGNGNSGNNGNGNSGNSGNNGNGDGTGGGDTTNTGGSTNQSGILFPIEGEVSELEQEMIDMIKTDGKHKDYELIEYVNDVNREHTEVLMELNINGIMDTAYSYGNERLTVERFDGWTGFYTYDPRGSVSGVTGMEGYIWQSYRYDAYGNITFGKPQYNNVYGYNAESYNPNIDAIYLRARYYNPTTADFMTEDSYLGNISDPLTLNRYSYVKASPLNYIDPSGHEYYWIDGQWIEATVSMPSNATRQRDWGSWSDAISNSQIKGNQRKQLTNAMETAEYAAQTQVCSDIVETGKDVFDFITSFLLGAITATVENATSWHTTWQSVNAEIQGKEFLTLTEILEGSVKNQMAFYIGKLVADVGGMIGGMVLAFLGMGGNAGGLTFAPLTGGASLSVTAAGTALALEGVAITVSAAGDISVSAEKIAAEISKSPSSSGSNDDSGDEGESETENPRDYLDEALERQGLEKTPKRLKEKWTDGEYNYEVRVHEGNSKYTDADSIYRVSRQKVPDPNPKVQGSGKEYLGSDGKWYHESELIEFNKNGTPNPLYNEHGAEVTHIPVD